MPLRGVRPRSSTDSRVTENDADRQTITVEVAYAEPARQWLEELQVPRGTTVADALSLALSGTLSSDTLNHSQAGIWGRPVDRSRLLKNGDRVELYRELLIDPRAARRERAAVGQSMGAHQRPKDRG